jgi:hypothetical protein
MWIPRVEFSGGFQATYYETFVWFLHMILLKWVSLPPDSVQNLPFNFPAGQHFLNLPFLIPLNLVRFVDDPQEVWWRSRAIVVWLKSGYVEGIVDLPFLG